MDAVIQIRNGAVKGFSIYADKSRGCAERVPLCASPDAFHSALKIRKSEVVPVDQGFLCCANVFGAARRRPNYIERSGSGEVGGEHVAGSRREFRAALAA
jgi:hypothetical protein